MHRGSEANGPVSPRTFYDEDSYLNSTRRTEILSTFPSLSPPLSCLPVQSSAVLHQAVHMRQRLLTFTLDCLLTPLSCGSSLSAKQDRKHCHSISIPWPHQRASARGRLPRLAIESPGLARATPAIYHTRLFSPSLPGGPFELGNCMANHVWCGELSSCRVPGTHKTTYSNLLRIAFFLQVLPIKKILFD